MKFHIISNNPIGLNSGFGIVARNIGMGLKSLGHEISFTGLQTSYVQTTYSGMIVYPGNYFSVGIDSLGQIIESVKYNLHKVQPDAVICIFQGDDGRLNSLVHLHKNTFWYCPIEGEGIPNQLIADMSNQYVHPVFMTNQGAEEYLNSPGVDKNQTVPVIYHGHDPHIFHPISEDPSDKICKWATEHYQYQQDTTFLCEHGCLACDGLNRSCDRYELEKIIVLSKRGEEVVPYSKLLDIKKMFNVDKTFLFVGQNFGVRKRIERLIEAFSIFSKDKSVMLHLHTYPVPSTGINLIPIIQKYGIVDKVVFSYGTLRSSGWSDQAMNLLYNSADIFVSASSVEGFGLPHLESMAVGLPQIAPDFSSFPEFIGEGIKSRGYLCKGNEQLTITGQTRILVDIDDMAENMNRLYSDNNTRERMSKNAIAWAREHTWENKCEKFRELLVDNN